MNIKLYYYRRRFILYLINLGIKSRLASQECDAHIDNVGLEDLDYENPEYDANECLSYWGD